MSLDSNSNPVPQKDLDQIFEEVRKGWEEKHQVEGNFDENFFMAMRRVSSWIEVKSVVAGVTDIFGCTPKNSKALEKEVIIDLGNKLGAELFANHYLRSKPKTA